eukprot:CAMPEP_0170167770 /NCGR_PEP_ID=MMETSP0040_2-20121228/1079_1 /TAXON_ID=641309 /ORGANISM="Lotharella oceanica, Strain CCMP622" /LENGTH=327 /DNA_ID=CAMNT_0010405895 /DNA_START=1 /DNA_END=984 /DNA_ORIENTATION=+
MDFGGPEVFQMVEIPTPEIEENQVLVKIAATSVNPIDIKCRSAPRPITNDLPTILGCDVAGTIAAVGSRVKKFAVGDRVFGCAGGVRGMGGALAEYIATDPRLLARAPRKLPLHEAAALPLVTITAWEGLFQRACVQPGDKVLVHGGTGGVGHVAVQLAKAKGCKVSTTVSSREKASIVERYGVTPINYREEPVESFVARLTDGRGFDVVFDATGGSDLRASTEAARVSGQIVTIVSQYEADLSPMHFKGLSLHVVFMLIPMLHGLITQRERQGTIMKEAARMADASELTPLIDDMVFGLDSVAAAHARTEGNEKLGKVVVRITDDE